MTKRLQLVSDRDFYQNLNQKHWAVLNEQIKEVDLRWEQKALPFILTPALPFYS